MIDRSQLATKFYVYKRYSQDLGVFYIGSHECKGRKPCTESWCNYKSSSAEIRRLEVEHPSANWDMQILEYAPDRPAMAAMEREHIRSVLGKEGCLNKRAQAKGVQGARSHRRRVKMVNPEFKLEMVRASQYLPLIKRGWKFGGVAQAVHLRHDRREQTGLFSHSTILFHVNQIMKAGWVYGYSSYYEEIDVRRFVRSLRLTEFDAGQDQLVLEEY